MKDPNKILHVNFKSPFKPYEQLEAIAEQNASERSGMVNAYKCGRCEEVIIAVLRTHGVTPSKFTCPNCGVNMISNYYFWKDQYKKPTHEFIRPRSPQEVLDLFEDEFNAETDKAVVEAHVKQVLHWWQGCGLFLRKIK